MTNLLQETEYPASFLSLLSSEFSGIQIHINFPLPCFPKECPQLLLPYFLKIDQRDIPNFIFVIFSGPVCILYLQIFVRFCEPFFKKAENQNIPSGFFQIDSCNQDLIHRENM